ncbi:MAG: AAA family ATPase [Elusimicrobiota bacterium]
MVKRLLSPSKTSSFFIFGPRGTGKTTFLRDWVEGKNTLWIDLLDPDVEDLYSRSPGTLGQEIRAAKNLDWVVIDEIQKIPRLLDIAHASIESSRVKFALTGSSARQLKKGTANLLAGRAFVYELFPLTHAELGEDFELSAALRWGGLPKPALLPSDEDKGEFLRAYARTYLKEEVWAEHIVRRLDPFRRFLEAAAQCSGDIVNFTNIARDSGADVKTVQSYFEVLEDTLVGILLDPYHESIRKRQRANPKFYLFDTGVKRAFARTLTETIEPRGYAYGRAFEHFVILEAHRINSYLRKDYRFSYLRTKDDAEIDLVVERPGAPTALVEIKSADRADVKDAHALERLARGFGNAEAFLLSRDPRLRKIGEVSALPWDRGLAEIGLGAARGS